LYCEERDFYRRFPNATKHPNRRPAVHREQETKITIPSRSGLSWKVAEEDPSSDVTRKGRHMSAVEEPEQKGKAQSKTTLTKSEGKTILKPKSDKVAKDPAKTEAEKSHEKPGPKEEPKQDLKQESKQAHSQPAPSLAIKPELIKIKEGDDPVVQELVAIFNSIITGISINDSTLKQPVSVSVEIFQNGLDKIGQKIATLRKEAENAAEEEIRKAHAAFDESARDLIRQIDEARAAEAAQFREEFEVEREKLSLAYKDKIKTELQRAQELAEQRLRNELVEQAIELNRKYLNDVKGLVEKERQGRLSKLNELTANVNQLEKLTSGWNDVIDTNLKTQQLQVAVDAVRSVLESSDMPKPFVRELVAVKELASDDPVVTAAIASINPTAYQRGIPSTPRIIDRFRRVAGEVRKVSLLPEDAGIANHAASFVLSKIMFKKDGLAGEGDVESILTRTENLLEEGNLDAAAREMNTLQGWAKILSKDWLADVRRVLEVRQALEVSVHSTIDCPSQSPSLTDHVTDVSSHHSGYRSRGPTPMFEG
jgi:MICOS complex subunit MIC60